MLPLPTTLVCNGLLLLSLVPHHTRLHLLFPCITPLGHSGSSDKSATTQESPSHPSSRILCSPWFHTPPQDFRNAISLSCACRPAPRPDSPQSSFLFAVSTTDVLKAIHNCFSSHRMLAFDLSRMYPSVSDSVCIGTQRRLKSLTTFELEYVYFACFGKAGQ